MRTSGACQLGLTIPYFNYFLTIGRADIAPYWRMSARPYNLLLLACGQHLCPFGCFSQGYMPLPLKYVSVMCVLVTTPQLVTSCHPPYLVTTPHLVTVCYTWLCLLPGHNPSPAHSWSHAFISSHLVTAGHNWSLLVTPSDKLIKCSGFTLLTVKQPGHNWSHLSWPVP